MIYFFNKQCYRVPLRSRTHQDRASTTLANINWTYLQVRQQELHLLANDHFPLNRRVALNLTDNPVEFRIHIHITAMRINLPSSVYLHFTRKGVFIGPRTQKHAGFFLRYAKYQLRFLSIPSIKPYISEKTIQEHFSQKRDIYEMRIYVTYVSKSKYDFVVYFFTFMSTKCVLTFKNIQISLLNYFKIKLL